MNYASGVRLLNLVHVLAANLNTLIKWNKEHGKPLSSNAKLAKKAGVSSSTIGQMRRAEGAVTISSLSQVADALGVTPWQLITPGLAPGDLPEVISDPGEKRLLMAFRDRRRTDRGAGETAH
jgi:transcriptional regulator with XRE-family HTH domain